MQQAFDQVAQGAPVLDARRADAARRIRIFGLPLDLHGSLAETVALIERRLEGGETLLTSFINPSCLAMAQRDGRYAESLSRLDMVLPDGMGVVHAVARLQGERVARISFDSTSLAVPVFELAARMGKTVALVGGAPGVAARAGTHLEHAFPGLRIVLALDGYGERAEKAQEIRAAGADIVVCGMGAGLQEAFLLELADAGWVGCGFTCGGYLDQLGAGLQYYPGWIDRTNLRWLYRLAREPRRLWHRYLVDYQRFGYAFLQEMLARKLSRQPA